MLKDEVVEVVMETLVGESVVKTRHMVEIGLTEITGDMLLGKHYLTRWPLVSRHTWSRR